MRAMSNAESHNLIASHAGDQHFTIINSNKALIMVAPLCKRHWLSNPNTSIRTAACTQTCASATEHGQLCMRE
jgi:hypothetical protein